MESTNLRIYESTNLAITIRRFVNSQIRQFAKVGQGINAKVQTEPPAGTFSAA